MSKNTWGFVLGLVLLAGVYTPALGAAKPQILEGIITQVNQSDGSFVLRLRDGSTLNIANPFQTGAFVSFFGTPVNGSVNDASLMRTKDPKGPDAIPALTLLDPGSGQVGTRITITGTGFTRKNNSIRIGGVQNALTGTSSPDGKTLSFILPAAPCDKTLKTPCPTHVIDPGIYNIAVRNQNGLSNDMPFQILPLPNLGIQTDILPQASANTRYTFALSGIGGAESYVWRIVSGNLPAGLRFAQAPCKDLPCRADGVISGIPATPGTYQFTVDLTSGGEDIARSYQLTVVQGVSGFGY